MGVGGAVVGGAVGVAAGALAVGSGAVITAGAVPVAAGEEEGGGGEKSLTQPPAPTHPLTHTTAQLPGPEPLPPPPTPTKLNAQSQCPASDFIGTHPVKRMRGDHVRSKVGGQWARGTLTVEAREGRPSSFVDQTGAMSRPEIRIRR